MHAFSILLSSLSLLCTCDCASELQVLRTKVSEEQIEYKKGQRKLSGKNGSRHFRAFSMQ